ncbi:MAG: HAD family hydrolase [Armatimonadetes bacterium]|nr:HAD family hydrolase [Armatimonadota bacterium]
MRDHLSRPIYRGCPGSPCPQAAPEPLPTAFFDRDGVLNVDHGYVYRREDFEFTSGALGLLLSLKERGFRVVVVTNQSGIGRGFYTEEQFLELSQWMLGQAAIDAVVYCPHAPEEDCPARKPKTGLFDWTERCLGVDKAASFLVGDKITDIQAADSFGVRGFLYKEGDLFEFVRTCLA